VRYDWDLEAAWNFAVAPPYMPYYAFELIGPFYNHTLFLQVGLRLWTARAMPAEPDASGWPKLNSPGS